MARDAQGELSGVLGFKTQDGGLVGGEMRDLARVYGWFGALWRGPVLSLLERELQPEVVQLDGIFVADDIREAAGMVASCPSVCFTLGILKSGLRTPG